MDGATLPIHALRALTASTDPADWEVMLIEPDALEATESLRSSVA